MLLVIWFHIPTMTNHYFPEYHNQYLDIMRSTDYVYNPFFLTVFFVSSGYFFKVQDFGLFIWKNVRALIFPVFFASLIINTIHTILNLDWGYLYVFLKDCIIKPNCWIEFFGQWFIGAMFWARIITYSIYRITDNKYLQAFLFFACYWLGYYCTLDWLNITWIRQGFIFAIYLFFGRMLRQYEHYLLKWYMPIAYIIVLAIVMSANIEIIPIGMGIRCSVTYWPFFLILGSLGSISLIYAAKNINKNHFLQFVGQNTIIFYLFNGFITIYSIRAVIKFVPKEYELLNVICLSLVIITANIIAGSIFSWMLNKKCLKFMIGR